jgi:hypothetical protein
MNPFEAYHIAEEVSGRTGFSHRRSDCRHVAHRQLARTAAERAIVCKKDPKRLTAPPAAGQPATRRSALLLGHHRILRLLARSALEPGL